MQKEKSPPVNLEKYLEGKKHKYMSYNRTNYAKDISAQVYDAYSSTINVFEVEIPLSVRAAEISAEGSSIYEYDPKGKAAYQSL